MAQGEDMAGVSADVGAALSSESDMADVFQRMEADLALSPPYIKQEQDVELGHISEYGELQQYFQEPGSVEQWSDGTPLVKQEQPPTGAVPSWSVKDQEVLTPSSDTKRETLEIEQDTVEKVDVMGMLDLHQADDDNSDVVNAREAVSEEREEGEVDEDLAKCIHSRNVQAANGESHGSDVDEADIGWPETMEDSDPAVSSSSDEEDASSDISSDEEDWKAVFKMNGPKISQMNERTEKTVQKLKAWSSDDEDEDQPPRTKNEILALPRVPKVEVKLQPHHKLIPIGKISSVLGAKVIVEGDENHQALDEGSILWLSERQIPLGFVDEVFGPVKKPFYLVRFNDLTELPEETQEGVQVAYVPDFATTVLKTPHLYKKGYDASGVHDEELSEDDVEFSDDEKEAEYKRMKSKAKRGGQQEKEDGEHHEGVLDDKEKRSRARPRKEKQSHTFGSGVPQKDRRFGNETMKRAATPASYGQGPRTPGGDKWNGRHVNNSDSSNLSYHHERDLNLNQHAAHAGPIQGHQHTAAPLPSAYWPGPQQCFSGCSPQAHYQPVGFPLPHHYDMHNQGYLFPQQFQGMQYQVPSQAPCAGQFFGPLPNQGGMLMSPYSPGPAPNCVAMPSQSWWPTGPVVNQPPFQRPAIQDSRMAPGAELHQRPPTPFQRPGQYLPSEPTQDLRMAPGTELHQRPPTPFQRPAQYLPSEPTQDLRMAPGTELQQMPPTPFQRPAQYLPSEPIQDPRMAPGTELQQSMD